MTRPKAINAAHDVNLWIVPLRMSLGAVLLFALTLTPDMLAANHVIHIPDWFTMGSIDDARAILSAMLGCVSTVLALIFSVALLVLSMVANLFGPRLLYRFVQDWVTQVCIGLFMAAFIYVFLVFLVTHQDEHSSFVPQVSLITSWFVVLAAFSFLVFYSHRVAMLIQNPDAIGRIVDDLRVVVSRIPAAATGADIEEDDAKRLAQHERDRLPVLSMTSGYLQHIDHAQLVAAAVENDALIAIPFRPGQFVLEGEVIGFVSPPSAQAELARELERHVKLGRHRVLYQDIEFGIAQIVEIAIRALSPAINDTFTGIACVDLLGESLTVLAAGNKSQGRAHDERGVLRLQIRPLRVSRLIKQGFDQIRQAAADNPAGSIRLLSTIGRLGCRMQHPDQLQALREQAAAVWESATSKSPVGMDLEDMEAAWNGAQAKLAEASSRQGVLS
jgi:uncharacterized membrane protein